MSSISVINFPFLSGQWKVFDPLGHTPFSLDFVGVSHQRYLKSTSIWQYILKGTLSDKFLGWGQEVHAPISGKVIVASDGWQDNEKAWLFRDIFRAYTFSPRNLGGDLRPLVGNHLYIESDIGVVCLAHLRCGSISVVQGETVHAGQPVAQVGNSGITLGPHLHLHVMDNIDHLSANFIPFRFSSYERYCRDGSWISARNSVPVKGNLVRAHRNLLEAYNST